MTKIYQQILRFTIYFIALSTIFIVLSNPFKLISEIQNYIYDIADNWLVIGFTSILCLFSIWHNFIYPRLVFPHLNELKIKTVLVTNSVCLICSYFLVCRFLFASKLTFIYAFNCITLTDLIVTSIALMLFKYEYDNKNKTSNNYFFNESLNEEDLLGYNAIANNLINAVIQNNSKNSFNIAVVGNWGDGKSFFLNAFDIGFEKYNDSPSTTNKINIVKINSWLERQNLIDNIILKIKQEVKEHNYTDDFNDYLEVLSSDSLNPYKNLFQKVVGINKKSLTGTLELINQHLEQTNAKTVVLIDEVDRLDKEDILELLRGLKTTLNFHNTTFIVALDYKYVRSSIDENSSQDYLKKIFQLYVKLPLINHSNLRESLNVKLDYFFKENNDLRSSIEDFLQNEIVINSIANIRDLHRFLNSVKLNHRIIDKTLNIKDFLTLELLKTSYFPIYSSLRSKSILISTSTGTYTIKKDDVTPLLKFLIEHDLTIMNNSGDQEFSKFKYPRNFYRYFSYSSFKLISFTEFYNNLIENSKSTDASTFLSRINDSNISDLNLFFNTINFQEFDKKKFINAILSVLISNQYNKHLKIIFDQLSIISQNPDIDINPIEVVDKVLETKTSIVYTYENVKILFEYIKKIIFNEFQHSHKIPENHDIYKTVLANIYNIMKTIVLEKTNFDHFSLFHEITAYNDEDSLLFIRTGQDFTPTKFVAESIILPFILEKKLEKLLMVVCSYDPLADINYSKNTHSIEIIKRYYDYFKLFLEDTNMREKMNINYSDIMDAFDNYFNSESSNMVVGNEIFIKYFTN